MSKVATSGPLNLDDIVTRRPRVQGVGIVKTVLSGDTFIVEGSASAGKPQEKKISISGINAPRLGFGKNGIDDPFAFAAREFLRDQIHGKVVHFVLVNASPAQANEPSDPSKLEFADVTVDGVDLAQLLVTRGYASVNVGKPRDDGKEVRVPPEREHLQTLEAQAKKAKVGIHNPKNKNAIRKLDWEPNTVELYQQYKDRPILAYVDRVLDGSTLRVEVPSGDLNHRMAVFNLAGVSAPRIGNKDYPHQPFAEEARNYVDARLNGKRVSLLIQGIDHRGALYGSIIHPVHGNIALHLLSRGLVHYVPWSSIITGEDDLFKSTALSCRNGIYQETPYTLPARDVYDAILIQVVSGDCVVVQLADGTEQRVFLASISAPRMIGGKFQPWAFEAREFLRRSLIGKRVRVEIEHVQIVKDKQSKATVTDAIPDDPTDGDVSTTTPSTEVKTRIFASVFKGKYNIANELVANGFADVSASPVQSLYFADLCTAEIKAKAEKKNKHGTKKPVTHIIDLSPQPIRGGDDASTVKEAKSANKANSERAEHTFKTLQSNDQTLAVLDAVYSPTRVRVFINSLNAFATITIAGITSPVIAKGEEKPQSHLDAMAYLRKFIQYDIVLEVVSLSRSSFIANIIRKESGENLAVTLLRKGLVSLASVGVDRNKYKSLLTTAETEAKKQRVGIWVDYDEEAERAAQEKARQEAAEAIGVGIYNIDGVPYINVKVTDVADPVHFYINNIDNKNVQVVADAMASFDPSVSTDGFNPQVGDIVAGLFDDDNNWYRVRIERHRKTSNTYDVQFIDFGNLATISHASLRPLPKELLSIKQLARPCQLSATKAPLASSEHYEPGANVLAMITVDKTFVARIDHSEPGEFGILHLTLFPSNYHDEATDKSKVLSINQELVREGYIRVDPRPHHSVKNVVAELVEHEEHARYNRNKIYEYGFYTSDTDE